MPPGSGKMSQHVFGWNIGSLIVDIDVKGP